MTTYIYKDELYHHGIKGQKWEIRRFQNGDGSLTPAGKKRYSEAVSVNDDLYLLKNKKGAIASFLSKRNEKIREETDKTRDYDIYTKSGKKIGNIELYSESDISTNIVWLGVDKRERGKKYAQSIMDWVIKNETKNGRKQLTLEVPGSSPDARHIYEKKGFVAGKQISDEDDIWGGLTKMERKL